jgi:disulfide oxidoreductase YuzD
VASPEIRSQHAAVIDEIETRGLLYPVTVVDGVPSYDGAVSYPAILRAIQERLDLVSA